MARRMSTPMDLETELYVPKTGRVRGRILSTTHVGVAMFDRLVGHFESRADDLRIVKGRLLEKILREACEKYGC